MNNHKKYILIGLCILFLTSILSAQENEEKSVTIRVNAPFFLLNDSTFNNEWYDFYSGTYISEKDMISIVSKHEESAKLLNRCKFDNAICWSFISLSLGCLVSSPFIKDTEIKGIIGDLGTAFAMGIIIPVYFKERHFNLAVDKYNQSVFMIRE